MEQKNKKSDICKRCRLVNGSLFCYLGYCYRNLEPDPSLHKL
jgi:hypothetical protein